MHYSRWCVYSLRCCQRVRSLRCRWLVVVSEVSTRTLSTSHSLLQKVHVCTVYRDERNRQFFIYTLSQALSMLKIFTSLLEWQLTRKFLSHDTKSQEVSTRPYSSPLLTSWTFNTTWFSPAGLTLIGKHAAQFKEYLTKDHEVKKESPNKNFYPTVHSR